MWINHNVLTATEAWNDASLWGSYMSKQPSFQVSERLFFIPGPQL